MKKIGKYMALLLVGTMLLTGCGAKDKESSASIEGSCSEILEKVYADADLPDDMREAMQYYQNAEITDAEAQYLLGTTEVKYSDSVYSMPMMSSVAYQCVVLRVDESQDVETAKQLLKDNADPRKWVCVEPETVLVENVGDVILYVMSEEQVATALQNAFTALGSK